MKNEIFRQVLHLAGQTWNHATGIFGTVVVVTALASFGVSIYEKAAESKAAKKDQKKKLGRQVAVITGASSGLGKMYAKMVDKHAKAYGINEIILIARREERLKELAAELTTPVRIFPMDLTDEKERKAFQRSLDEEKEDVQNLSVALLINCAGFGKSGLSEDIGYETENQMIELNDKAAIALTGLLLPYMRAGSRIAEVCSVAAFQPIPSFNAYAASKALLYSYSRSLRVELLKKGISVTAVCPYWIRDTEFIPIASAKKENGQNEKAQNNSGDVQKKGGKNLFMASRVSSVARVSLYDIRHRHAVSTPGILTTLDRIFAGLIPDGLLAYIMKLFMI